MIYRTNALERKPDIQFTFIEKMFVSNKPYHRFVGHTLLIGEELGKFGLIIGFISLIGGVVAAAIWLVCFLLQLGYHYLVNRNYTRGEAVSVFVVGVLILSVAICVVNVIAKLVKHNNSYMTARIDHKIDKHNREYDGSETT